MAFKDEDIKPIQGVVQKIIFRNESNGYTIFTIKTDKGFLVTVKGSTETPPTPFSLITAYGTLDKESKFKGIQFNAVGVTVEPGNGDPFHLARYLMSIVPYLGEEKSYRLAKQFGTRLEEVLEHSPELLTEVEGIGPKICLSIQEAWIEARSIRSIRIFLMKLGLPDRRINAIVKGHGVDYEEVIKSDPFVLMSDGIDFKICDDVMRMLGLENNDPVRYRGFIRSILRNATMSGHLFLTASGIIQEFSKFNSDTDEKFCSGPIPVPTVKEAIRELVKQGYVVIKDGGLVYDLDLFFYEHKSAEILSSLIHGATPKQLEKFNMDRFIDDYQKKAQLINPDFVLSDQQEEAIRSFQTNKVMVVTGPPGTGKTTILKAFVEMMTKTDLPFALMAPTGVAAKRLEQSAGFAASTVHRKLGYKGSSWDLGGDNKLPVKAVIIDESSMVDAELFFRILDALAPDARLVLVGDVDQLPSVGPGNVLKELIHSGQAKVIMLNKIHRQAETSNIVVAASRIRVGDQDLSAFEYNKLSHDAVILNTGNDEAKGMDALEAIARKLTQADSQFQVVTPRNQGSMSVASINTRLQEVLNPKVEGKKEFQLDKETVIRVGDKILITKNDYQIGVYNGDIGYVKDINKLDILVQLIGEDGFITLPLVFVKDSVKMAYALTCHKVQGMEYPIVLMALVKAHGKNLLQRNLVYTALTRAKKKVIIIGSDIALLSAIENAEQQKRNTSLSQAFVAACNGEDVLAPLRAISLDSTNAARVLNHMDPKAQKRLDVEALKQEEGVKDFEVSDDGKIIDKRPVLFE